MKHFGLYHVAIFATIKNHAFIIENLTDYFFGRLIWIKDGHNFRSLEVAAVFIYLTKTQRNTKINQGKKMNPDPHT